MVPKVEHSQIQRNAFREAVRYSLKVMEMIPHRLAVPYDRPVKISWCRESATAQDVRSMRPFFVVIFRLTRDAGRVESSRPMAPDCGSSRCSKTAWKSAWKTRPTFMTIETMARLPHRSCPAIRSIVWFPLNAIAANVWKFQWRLPSG